MTTPADWISPFVTATKIFGQTAGNTPYTFSTTSTISTTNAPPAATTFAQSASMNWVKYAGTYTIGWSSTVSISYSALAAGASVQQWISPRWVTGSASSYVNYYCFTSTIAPVAPSITPIVSTFSQVGSSTVDLQVIGVGGASTASSTSAALTLTPTIVLNNDVWLGTPTWTGTGPTYSFNCQAVKVQDPTSPNLVGINYIPVGGTVTFRAGFKAFKDTTTSAIAWSGTTTDFTYTLTDSAVMLSSSVAAVILSIAAVSF